MEAYINIAEDKASAVCCNRGWNMGCTHTSDYKLGTRVITMHPFKGFCPKGNTRKGECYGRVVSSSHEADVIALEKGYTAFYYSRPQTFITLTLSPRVRAWLKSKPVNARLFYLSQVIDKAAYNRDYFQAVLTQDYMESTRTKWLNYIENPSQGKKY